MDPTISPDNPIALMLGQSAEGQRPIGAPAGPQPPAGMSPDNPILSAVDPRYAVQRVVDRSLQQGTDYAGTEAELRRFGYDPTPDRDRLRGALDLGAARSRTRAERPFGSGPVSGTLAAFKKRYMPFNDIIPGDLPIGGDAPGAGAYSRAMRRFKDGTYDDDDLRTITKYEQQEQALGDMRATLDRSGAAGVAGRVIQEAGGVGKIVGEATLGMAGLSRVAPRLVGATAGAAAGTAPAVPTAGRTLAAYLGTRVPVTLAAPSLYVPMMQQNNLKAGRGANDPRGLPAAVAYGYATMLVLGQLQKGVKPGMSDWLKKGAIGVGELQLVDAAATVADAALPEGFGTGSEGGPIGKWLKARAEGKGDEADIVLGDTAIQMLVFGGLAKMHGHSPATVRDSYVTAVRELRKGGDSAGLAASKVKGLHDALSRALEADPNLTREGALEALTKAGGFTGPLSKYTPELLKAFTPLERGAATVAAPERATPPDAKGEVEGKVETTDTGATRLPPESGKAEREAAPKEVLDELKITDDATLRQLADAAYENKVSDAIDRAVMNEYKARYGTDYVPRQQEQSVATPPEGQNGPAVEPVVEQGNRTAEPPEAQQQRTAQQPAAPEPVVERKAAEPAPEPERRTQPEETTEEASELDAIVDDVFARIERGLPKGADEAALEVARVAKAVERIRTAEAQGDAELARAIEGRLVDAESYFTGRAGAVVPFDPATMSGTYAPGTMVRIERPGRTARSPDGRTAVAVKSEVSEHREAIDDHFVGAERFPRTPESPAELVEMAGRAADSSPNLTPQQRAEYKANFAEAVRRLPPAAFREIAKNLRGVKFFAVSSDAVIEAARLSARLAEGTSNAAEKAKYLSVVIDRVESYFKKTGGDGYGGCFFGPRGTLYINGGRRRRAGAPYRNSENSQNAAENPRAEAVAIYLHEMAHTFAMESANGKLISDRSVADPAWLEAFKEEILSKKLDIGNYSRVNSQEGFAELMTAIWGGRVPIAELRAKAPKAMRVVEQWQLLPREQPSDVGAYTGFTESVPTGTRGAHIDLSARTRVVEPDLRAKLEQTERSEPKPEPKPKVEPKAEPKRERTLVEQLEDLPAGSKEARAKAVEVLKEEYDNPEGDAESRAETEALAETAGLTVEWPSGEVVAFDPAVMDYAGPNPPAKDTAVKITRSGWADGRVSVVRPVAGPASEAPRAPEPKAKPQPKRAAEKIGGSLRSAAKKAPAPVERTPEQIADAELETKLTLIREQWIEADANQKLSMLDVPETVELLQKAGVDTSKKAINQRRKSSVEEGKGAVGDARLADAILDMPHMTDRAKLYLSEAVRNGWTMRQVARELGVDEGTVSKVVSASIRTLNAAREGKGPEIPRAAEILKRLAEGEAAERAEAQGKRGTAELDEFGRPNAELLDDGFPVPSATGDAIRHWATTVAGKYLRARGNLTREQYAAKKQEVDFALARYAERARTTVRDLDAGISEATGGRAKTSRDLNPAEARLLDDVLKGSQNALQALVSSPLGTPKVLDALARMRTEVDGLSVKLVRSGVVSGGMALRFLKGVGSYMTRQFEAFDRSDWRQRVPQAAFDAAVNGVRAELNQLYRANGQPLPPPELAVAYVESLLADTQSAARRTDILKQRQSIPDWLSDLWGEYRDPVLNFTQTVGKQSNLLAAWNFFTRIGMEGRGKVFFTNEELADYKRLFPNSGGAVEVATPDTILKQPLAGVKTAPEIKEAIESVFAKDAPGPRAYQYLAAVNYATKYAKTILSHPTIVTNFLSNWGKALMNGHIGRGNFTAGIRVLADDSPAGRATREKLIGLGVLNDNVTAGEFRETFREALGDRPGDAFAFGEGTVRRALRKGQALMEKAYHAGDNVWKAAAWVSEVKKWEPILGRTAAEQKAATVVRDTYPTYSEVAPAVRGLRSVPVIAPFVSFPAEVARTTKNTLATIFAELRDPRPAVRKIGAQRLAGTVAAAIGSYALAVASRSAFGVTAEEDEAARVAVPEFHRNARLWYTGRNADGTLKYVNGSKLDPNSYLIDALAAVFRDPSAKGISEAVDEMVRPFAQESITGRLALDLARNQKEPGGQVWDPAAPRAVRAGQVAARVYDAFEPGSLTALRRLGGAVAGGADARTGRDPSVRDELLGQAGGRVFTLDPQLELANRSVAFTREMAQAGRQTSRLIGQLGPASEDQLLTAAGRTDSARGEALGRLREMYKAAIALGVPPDKALQIMMEKEVPREALAAIVLGDPLPAYRPPRPRTEQQLERAATVASRPPG